MITGINTIRNGIKNGYPFVESILSVLPLVDEYLINDGGSTDGTLEALNKMTEVFPKIKLFQIPDYQSVRWDCVSNVLNHFIDIAQGNWIFLGNADELIHESDVKPLKETILSEKTADVLRYNRKEVAHNWTKLNEDYYWPVRTARKIPGLYQNWNSYGGDEFLDKDGWIKDSPRARKTEFVVYHLYAVFPGNMKEKRKNDAEWLAPGDEMRVKIYEGIKDNPTKFTNQTKGRMLSGLPALTRDMCFMPFYVVRDELFNIGWLEKLTGLSYS